MYMCFGSLSNMAPSRNIVKQDTAARAKSSYFLDGASPPPYGHRTIEDWRLFVWGATLHPTPNAMCILSPR